MVSFRRGHPTSNRCSRSRSASRTRTPDSPRRQAFDSAETFRSFPVRALRLNTSACLRPFTNFRTSSSSRKESPVMDGRLSRRRTRVPPGRSFDEPLPAFCTLHRWARGVDSRDGAQRAHVLVDRADELQRRPVARHPRLVEVAREVPRRLHLDAQERLRAQAPEQHRGGVLLDARLRVSRQDGTRQVEPEGRLVSQLVITAEIACLRQGAEPPHVRRPTRRVPGRPSSASSSVGRSPQCFVSSPDVPIGGASSEPRTSRCHRSSMTPTVVRS